MEVGTCFLFASRSLLFPGMRQHFVPDTLNGAPTLLSFGEVKAWIDANFG